MIAMILAAGLGTRLKPFTDFHPKALAIVNGKTVLQRNVEFLQQAGIRKVVVNVHHFAQQIIDVVAREHGWGSEILISDESEEVLETGGGVKKAIPLFGDTDNIVVMNADILTDLNLAAMIDFHVQSAASATLAVSDRSSSRSLLFDANNRLCGWKNSKTGETKMPVVTATLNEKSFSGIQVMHERLFRHMPFSGKFSLIDVYLQACANHTILGFDHSGGKFMDIGTQEKLDQAALVFP